MKIGAMYPVIELGGDPVALRRFGVEAERMNFDHILMYDHVLGAVHEDRDPPFTQFLSEKEPLHDPITCFSYLAGITEKIRFMFGILILPQRQVALVARQIADLSLFSNGRVILGVGSGWNYVEYEALGANWRARGKVMDEQIAALRKLWSEEVVTYEGQFHKMDRVAINPMPKVPVPIYIGGDSKVAFRRAARSGDGFVFLGPIDNALSSLAECREVFAEEGKSEEGFGKHFFMVPVGVNPREGGQPKAATRNIDGVVDELNRWRDAGGTTASVATGGMGFATIDEHLEYMQRIATRMGL